MARVKPRAKPLDANALWTRLFAAVKKI